jgi:hypothetical protein
MEYVIENGFEIYPGSYRMHTGSSSVKKNASHSPPKWALSAHFLHGNNFSVIKY